MHISTILSDRHFNSLKNMLNNEREKVRFAAHTLRLQHKAQFKNVAKAKATKKGLCINVETARKCPQTAVSVIPLPVLDLTQSPAGLSQLPTLKRRQRPPRTISPSLSRRCGVQQRQRPSSTPPAHPVFQTQVLSPLSSSLEMQTLPDVHSQAASAMQARPVLPRLDCPSVPAISVSYFSALSIENRVPTDVSNASDDDLFTPAAPACVVKELPVVCWFDIDLTPDTPSSSSLSSSGPETPRDSEDHLSLNICIRKRKMVHDEEEEMQHPKHNMKKRWASSHWNDMHLY